MTNILVFVPFRAVFSRETDGDISSCKVHKTTERPSEAFLKPRAHTGSTMSGRAVTFAVGALQDVCHAAIP